MGSWINSQSRSENRDLRYRFLHSFCTIPRHSVWVLIILKWLGTQTQEYESIFWCRRWLWLDSFGSLPVIVNPRDLEIGAELAKTKHRRPRKDPSTWRQRARILNFDLIFSKFDFECKRQRFWNSRTGNGSAKTSWGVSQAKNRKSDSLVQCGMVWTHRISQDFVWNCLVAEISCVNYDHVDGLSLTQDPIWMSCRIHEISPC